jgi:microcystin-dependent protein
MFEMDIKTIALIMFGIIILYLLYKTRKIQTNTGVIEGFAVTDEIRDAIKEEYKADIDAIRNLSTIATKITQANDRLIVPAGTTEMKGDAFIHGGLGIAGELKVTGQVIFNNRNTNMMEIFPSFMILMWLSAKIPKGWAPCDGGTYRLGPDGFAVTGIVDVDPATPDLRGRFPIGVGQGNGLTNKSLWGTGGSETHTLTEAEMPSHSHYGVPPYADNCWKGGDCKGDKGLVANTWQKFTEKTGGNQPHNNMPPWYAINFIMKL